MFVADINISARLHVFLTGEGLDAVCLQNSFNAKLMILLFYFALL